MTKYFTVKTLDGAGLGDQLATQFARLYSLGCLCQYEYTYTPFKFPRSHGYTNVELLISKIKKSICFNYNKIYDFWLARAFFKKIFNLADKIARKILNKNRNKKILFFLGFNNFENKLSRRKFSQLEVVEVDLHGILEDNKITSINQIKDILDSISSSSSLIYEFVWTGQTHSDIRKIDDILKKSGIDSLDFTNCKLAEQYWSNIKQSSYNLLNISNQKNHLVVHIRLGDSVSIDLGEKCLYVNDKSVYTSLDSMNSIFNIDPGRKPIKLEHYEITLNKIFERLGRENVFCTVLSDGYERTFDVIASSLLTGELKLSIDELTKLKSVEKKVNHDLKVFLDNYSDSSIIGESFGNFLQSIHMLASAKILVWGTGGFAYYTQKLFSKYPYASTTIHVVNNTEELFDEISKMNI